jgi:hypothetical protein
MARITKTFLFPVPEQYCGDVQDDFEVGIATYIGPRYLKTRWVLPDETGYIEDDWTQGCWGVNDPNGFLPCPVDCVEVILDAEEYPLHACMLYGAAYPPERFEVQVGPDSEPNADIADPYNLFEAIEPRSCGYDVTTNSWKQPQFRSDWVIDHIDVPEGESQRFSWTLVRDLRNHMLAECDHRVAASDIPDAVKQPWLEYRQQLRDLPETWASVGNCTYLIQWPFDPEAKVNHQRSAERKALDDLDPLAPQRPGLDSD